MKTIMRGMLMLLAGFDGTAIAAGSKIWPKQHYAIVQASVAFNGEAFAYSYKITAAAANEYPISRFELDLRLNPDKHPLSRKDLSSTHTAAEHAALLESAPKIEVSEISSPDGWESFRAGVWGAIEFQPGYMLNPGKSRSGYSFVSQGPPAIRDAAIDAYSWDFFEHPVEYRYPGRRLNRVGDPDELTTEVNKGIQYLGKTIAPVTPPEPFTIGSWTARMTADVVEARKLKWIKTDRNLLEVKKLIVTLNTEDKSALVAAVKKIESYMLVEKKKGNISDEADALIRLNAQYLLRRLVNPEGIVK